MIRATISEVKNGLSAYLPRVRSGESVLILDRGTPIARIVPVGRALEHATHADVDVDVDADARIERLVRAGVLSRQSFASPLEVLGQPFRPGAGILEALLEERSEERRELHR